MNTVQGILHTVEEGKGRILTRLIPFVMVLLVVTLIYDYRVFSGLTDEQSMDNAQLARQIVRGQGFTTKFIRPAALIQLSQLAPPVSGNGKVGGLFPESKFPAGTERVLPDTYNAPAFPYLLAGWFKLMNPQFDETPREIVSTRSYVPDHRIPWLNQLLLGVTGLLIFFLGLRLFDPRVAWTAMTAFFVTNLVWQFSITALSTTCLMFLCTIILIVAVEIYSVGEACFASTEASFWPAWLWTLLLGVVVGLTCLMRLNLVGIVVPLALFLICVPQGGKWLVPLFVIVSLGIPAPWFWHMYQLTGSIVGSNVPYLHYGADGRLGNQIFCTMTPPNYQQLFKDVASKEFSGFGWNFVHGWELLGASPLVLLFFGSILHTFKRPTTQAIRWLILGTGFCLIAVTSCGVDRPTPLDPWNSVIILLPGMMVVGSAFFFILLDRLHLQLWVLNDAITIALLVVAAWPLIGVALDTRGNRAYPPYSAPAIRAMGDFVVKDQWITTDMPWAVAWYGDHSAVWIPDSLADFYDIYDNYNNSGLLFISPVLLGTPATTFTSGEYKDWMPFISSSALPANFPLNARAPSGAGFIEYMIWGHGGGN